MSKANIEFKVEGQVDKDEPVELKATLFVVPKHDARNGQLDLNLTASDGKSIRVLSLVTSPRGIELIRWTSPGNVLNDFLNLDLDNRVNDRFVSRG